MPTLVAAENGVKAGVNQAHFRAICLHPDCPWKWQSSEKPDRPELARVQAIAHTNQTHHRTETVFDVFAQHDEFYVPRSV